MMWGLAKTRVRRPPQVAEKITRTAIADEVIM